MSLDNPAFKTMLFYEALLILKMLAMSVFTGFQRFKNKVINIIYNLLPNKGT